jgi:acetylornithine aminotransferase
VLRRHPAIRVRLSPTFAGLGAYPFTRLDDARADAASRGIDVIDFGVGEPREETPPFIRDALAAGIQPVSTYPKSAGLPETCQAVAGWVRRRFGTEIVPDQAIPTLGSKEAIFHLAQMLDGDTVAVTSPGYPVPARGALFAGKDVATLPLTAERDWLPDLDEVPWGRLAILWLNYPNNPTGATAPLAFLEQAAERARACDAVLACDEAYSELWFDGQAPAGGLQLRDLRNVIVFNTLSKRSSMPGYRAGFAAGDGALIQAMRRYRPNVGVAPQEFVQRAAIAAYADEDHVADVRDLYRAKREVMLPALESIGLVDVGGPATFFLWMKTPVADEEAYAISLLDRGILCAPGSAFGPEGAGHVRFALVPTLRECELAAERLAG